MLGMAFGMKPVTAQTRYEGLMQTGSAFFLLTMIGVETHLMVTGSISSSFGTPREVPLREWLVRMIARES